MGYTMTYTMGYSDTMGYTVKHISLCNHNLPLFCGFPRILLYIVKKMPLCREKSK